jgi:uncharacterized damage-inducible protein DinB
MDDQPPPATVSSLESAVIDEQIHLLQAAVVKLQNCFQQLNPEQLWWRPASDQNSIGNLALHVCGNLNQWVVSGVGGEPDRRDRQAEFEACDGHSVESLLLLIDETIATVAQVLRSTTVESLLARRTIQGFEVTGLRAIIHSISHFVGHTHQIIQLTRLQLGSDYTFAWSPESQRDHLPI